MHLYLSLFHIYSTEIKFYTGAPCFHALPHAQKVFRYGKAVNTKMEYDYNRLVSDCGAFVSRHKYADLFSIGESVMEHKLFCLKFGEGRRKLFINGAHHGLEYLTAAFIMRFLEEYAAKYESGEEMFGYNVRDLFARTTLYAVPMVNPDGVDIAMHGIDVTNPHHRRLVSLVGIHSFHKVWQANANGVDINHNYNADWRVVETRPSPSKYSGPYSESEPETQAIVEFVRNTRPDMLMAFHSQGGEIYYDFDGRAEERSRELALEFSRVSGYSPASPSGSAAFGGCKDWFINEFGKAGFTIEIGHGKNPLPTSMLDKIYRENSEILLCALTRA